MLPSPTSNTGTVSLNSWPMSSIVSWALNMLGLLTVLRVFRAVRWPKTTMQGQRLLDYEHQTTKDNTDKQVCESWAYVKTDRLWILKDKCFLTLYSTPSNQTERFCFPLHPCLTDIGGTQYPAVSMHWIQTKNKTYFYDKSESSGLPFNHTSVPIAFLPVCYMPPLSSHLPPH